MNVNLSLLTQLPRGRDFNDLTIENTCQQPWKTLSVDLQGDCYLCRCEAHLPVSVGKITDFETLESIWTNNTAVKLQETITSKTFTYCAVDRCGIMQKNILLDRYHIAIAIDESCNIACPSCRKTLINHLNGTMFEIKQNMILHFVNLINKFDRPLDLIISGNGDPLASAIMRPLLLNWRPKDNQHITLRSNGLLMKKLLPDSTILNHIRRYSISVDAGSELVYEKVRYPGKYSVIRENLDWLASIKKKQNAEVRLNFCLSATNADDIVNFSNMCVEYNFIGEIAQIEDWKTFDNFSEHDVIGNQSHPLHHVAINQLRQVSKNSHIVINPSLLKFVNDPR